MIYTVTFNPAIDYVVRLDAPLEVGQVNRACGEDCVLGGKGINVSGVLAQLGCPSVALGFVAGETGAWLERGLAAQGLHTDFVHLENGMTRINVKIKAGQETELNGAGPDIPDEALHQLEEKLDGLTENDVLILAGSIPASLPQDVYERLLARLDGRGVRCVVDATRALLVNVLPYHPFLIKPNNHELGEIVGRELHTDEEIAAAARTLQEKGARNVLVSMAGDGALLLDEQGQMHRIGCPKGRVVNSVGAGDSMVAGFVAGWQQTRSLMALGMDRSLFGDLMVEDGTAYLLAMPEAAKSLQDEWHEAGHTAIRVRLLDAPPQFTPPQGAQMRDTVASLRLDCVLAAGMSLSRARAAEIIRQGLVQRNHTPEERVDTLLEAGDLLSIRGFGRIRLTEIGGRTRKDRISIQLEVFKRERSS